MRVRIPSPYAGDTLNEQAAQASKECGDRIQVFDEDPGKSDLIIAEPVSGDSMSGDAHRSAAHSEDPAASPVALKPHPWSSSWARDVLVSICVSAFIIVFLYQPVRVEGTSMLPTLQDEDRLFINKIAYRVGEIHRGDVVVFLYPHDHSKSYIKRVVAVAGDELRIDHGRVYVNGNLVKEDYVPKRYADERSSPEEIIPPHEYFVLGDHRSVASDSRDFGTVDRDLIYGKAAFVYWPVDQMGVVR